MQQVVGTPVPNNDGEVVSREAWERPVLERLAAQEAQNALGGSAEGPGLS
jgi:hypothetical protein